MIQLLLQRRGLGGEGRPVCTDWPGFTPWAPSIMGMRKLWTQMGEARVKKLGSDGTDHVTPYIFLLTRYK